MRVERFPLSPPSLDDISQRLKECFAANFEESDVVVVQCPDLRKAPFHLATEGLAGEERIADVGGQPNLFPSPRLDCIWSMADIAKAIDMNPAKGSLIGAGAGPFNEVGSNCELCPNLAWKDNFDNIDNRSYVAKIDSDTGAVRVKKSPSSNCALMINLFGSLGERGQVIKISARKRKGDQGSFTECIRKGLSTAYGASQTVSLGGAFVVKTGKTRFHVMPDFPSKDELPFKDPAQLNDWLTYHEFEEPIVCLSVLHSADPEKHMGLRMEHTHGFSPSEQPAGGHYHCDIDPQNQEIEYEGYFNTAKAIYRVDRPAVTLSRDLHE